MRRPLPRLRVRYTTRPRPALELTDTPRPGCQSCNGNGGWNEYYADGGPEDGDAFFVDCGCWDPSRAWLLLPVPRWIARRLGRGWPQDGYSSEPPF